MIPVRVCHYRDPAAVLIGLGELRKRGLTARGLLFIAVDTRGECHIAIPDDFDVVTRLRVGDKLSLKPPWEGRYYHFDAIHRLPGGSFLWNGDRRLEDSGSASEVARAVAMWLKGSGSARNVFLGCTPHQEGSWWLEDEQSPVVDLHATGMVSTVVTHSGILARRIGEPTLYHLSFADVREHSLRKGWQPVFQSELGNILMLERRVMNYSVVLTCEQGLIEIDVSGLPESATEISHVRVRNGCVGVVGRIDGGAFAVTKGRVEPWGLADVGPALLVGSANQTLRDLPKVLERRGTPANKTEG